MAAISVAVKSGSKYEYGQFLGSSHSLQNIAFTETQNRTHLRLVREMEAIGANAQALASREFITYEVEVPKAAVAQATEILMDTVANPALNVNTLKRAKARCQADLGRLGETDRFIDMNVHSRGYKGALATPLYGNAVGEAGIDALAAFHAGTHGASRMVVSAAGVPHDAFVQLVSPMAGALGAGQQGDEPKSQYVGGMAVKDQAEHNVVALAFEGKDGVSDLKRDVLRHVATKLMGGGGSFSTGGPGKGMHSRLYLRVLCQDTNVSDCSFFHESYSTSALLGIRISGARPTDKLLDIAAREMTAAAGSLTTEEVERAKAAMEGDLCMILESASVVADDLAKTVSIYGKRVEPQEYLDAIRAVTPAAVQKELQAALATPPTVVACGSGSPSYDAVVNKLK